jgi:hypothetical protein
MARPQCDTPLLTILSPDLFDNKLNVSLVIEGLTEARWSMFKQAWCIYSYYNFDVKKFQRSTDFWTGKSPPKVLCFWHQCKVVRLESDCVFFHPSCKTRKCKNAERDFGSFPIARIPNKKKIIRFLYLALLGSQKYRKILWYLLTHDGDTWLLWLHYKVHQKALVGMC